MILFRRRPIDSIQILACKLLYHHVIYVFTHFINVVSSVTMRTQILFFQTSVPRSLFFQTPWVLARSIIAAFVDFVWLLHPSLTAVSTALLPSIHSTPIPSRYINHKKKQALPYYSKRSPSLCNFTSYLTMTSQLSLAFSVYVSCTLGYHDTGTYVVTESLTLSWQIHARRVMPAV